MLFNRTIPSKRDSEIYPGFYRDRQTKVEVTEHRAPTDESVRLLNEMQEKARDSLVLAMRTDANGFKCTAHVFKDYAKNALMMRLRFALNETPYDKELKLPQSMYSANRETWLRLVRDEIAKSIAETIVLNLTADGTGICKLNW